MAASAMSAESLDQDRRQILEDITQAILAVSDNIPPSQKIEMDTLLIADLGLESIEIANLLFRLNARYSGAVSFADFITEVAGADWQSDASVGGIVDFVAASLRVGQAHSGMAPGPAADQEAHS
jgi:acyl carrier protein